MKRLSLLLISSFSLFACQKEKTTLYSTTLFNSTNHKILILPFKFGIVQPEDTIKLDPNSTFEIALGVDRGLVSIPGFFSKYFGQPEDSILVIFDNIYSITHYANEPNNKAMKYYLFNSLRNIGNPNSYEFKSVRTSKYKNTNTHKYTFTEQDYLDTQ